MSKVLLIDMDSTIPNLALMKISSYHKAKGDEVSFFMSDPDYVYCSIIFKKNRHNADALSLLYPDAVIDVGGSGYDLKKRLPEEIDRMTPDYSLYPDNDSYYGFTSRGCIRNCHFCIVRRKEGSFHRVYENVNQAFENICGGYTFKKITLMDNNILADPELFFSVTDEILRRKLKVDFNQGLDIRLVTREIASRISKLKLINTLKFAFDDESYEDSVINGVRYLRECNVNLRHKTLFYVYVNDDSDYDSAVRRCRLLKALGTTPYIMLNKDVEHTKRMKQLKRWCRPWIFWKIDITEYEG